MITEENKVTIYTRQLESEKSERKKITIEIEKVIKKKPNNTMSQKIQKIQLMSIILCYLCIFGIALALIIKYFRFSEYEYIWFCSKILTIKNMLNKTINIDLVFSQIDNGESIYFPNHYIDYLERIKEDGGCLEGYKACGILDTYGNSFCMLPNGTCPINKIVYDLYLKDSEYRDNNYEYYETDNSKVYLFYRRDVLDSGIITSWLKQKSQPKYINKKNFILDKKALKEFFKLKNDDENNQNNALNFFGKELINSAVDYISDLSNNLYDLDRIKKLFDYIVNKIEKDENNIDYNFSYINNHYYVKNYMGFENLEAVNNFNKIDFNAYKRRYPNYITLAVSISILCIITFFMLALVIYFKKYETIKFHKAFIAIFVIIYVSSFFYLLFYSIHIFIRDFRNRNFQIAKSIKADKFIEDFLKEFYSPFDKATFILCIIIILLISIIFFILFWVIEPISKCKHKRKQIKRNKATNK